MIDFRKIYTNTEASLEPSRTNTIELVLQKELTAFQEKIHRKYLNK